MEWLDTAEQVSRTFSIAALPVVVAVGGWLIQRRLQKQTISRDYVQLAVTILQNPDTAKVPADLRGWAVDLLNENAPTKLSPQAIQSLKSGALTLPSFRFVSTGAVSASLEHELEVALSDFQKYLEGLGFTGVRQTVSVQVSPGTTVNVHGQEMFAAWDGETSSILVAAAFAADTPLVLRQLAHHYLHVPDTSWACCAIESGLATYFACSFSGHPAIGDKASDAGQRILPRGNLKNRRQFDEINLKEWASVQHDGSEVWGGAFWEVRELLGPQAADRLLSVAWRESSPRDVPNRRVYAVFASNLLARVESGHNEKHPAVRAVFEGRGLHQ